MKTAKKKTQKRIVVGAVAFVGLFGSVGGFFGGNVLAAPLPDFLTSPGPTASQSSTTVQQVPSSPALSNPLPPANVARPMVRPISPTPNNPFSGATTSSGNRKSLADLSGIPDVNIGGDDALAHRKTDMTERGNVDIFDATDINESDKAFLTDLVKLRERVILDELKSKAASLEQTLSKFEAVPPDLKPIHPKKIKKEEKTAEPKPEMPNIAVLGIHDDRVFVKYDGHSEWVTIGAQVGKYRLKAVSGDNAVFESAKGKVFKIKKAPKVIPRPKIVVTSIKGQTAIITYLGDNYTVTIGSPIGSDLTVTALTDSNFSVTDAHGRVFSYPVPQQKTAQAGAPGFPPGGYQPPPPPGFNQGAQQQSTSAEDTNY